MPKISIRLFANLREYTKTKELELEGNTIRDILEILCNEFPGLGDMLLDGENLRPYMNVFLNGRNIHELNGSETVLHPGDEVALFPPVSGG